MKRGEKEKETALSGGFLVHFAKSEFAKQATKRA